MPAPLSFVGPKRPDRFLIVHAGLIPACIVIAALVFAPTMLLEQRGDSVGDGRGARLGTPRDQRAEPVTSNWLKRLVLAGGCAIRGLHAFRPVVGPEALIGAASVLLACIANTTFWRGALAGRSALDMHTWIIAGALLVLLAGVHFLLLSVVTTRRSVRPVLMCVFAVSVIADQFMGRYGIVLDASMLRNVSHTDVREAAELLTARTVWTVLAALTGGVFFLKFRLQPRPFWAGVRRRAAAIGGVSVVLVAVLLLSYQDLSSLMRTHKSLRYTINPASIVWSLGSNAISDARAITVQRDPPEPVQRLQRAGGGKATLLVVVVGETARAANFSLNGYARATTPELAALDLINSGRVRACGTSTEVSLPCMFSPFGRSDYDEAQIRRHESLLHVLSHAGYRVVWLDNQSGCKGVCEGIETRDLTRDTVPGICSEGRCLDEILTQGLGRIVAVGSGDTVVVLHQLGNHGPAYFRRYPPEMKRFTPACEKEELRDCSREEIVNAYDNAIAYTDRFLAGVVKQLEALRERYDVAMVYASDHGESLGERGLYLHGIPYAIAPSEQVEVPMLWWLPRTTASALGFDESCFRGKASRGASHDNLYHTILGMLGVKTPRYRAERDLSSDCRRPVA